MRSALVFVALASAVLLTTGIWNFIDKYEGDPGARPTPVPTPVHLLDADGNAVPRDKIEIFRGPEHCNWGSSLMLFTGDPIGTEMVRNESERQYVRDPEGVYNYLRDSHLAVDYDPDTRLPNNAMPTDYSWEGRELWLDPVGPDTSVYVVYDDHVERWPRANPVIRCR